MPPNPEETFEITMEDEAGVNDQLTVPEEDARDNKDSNSVKQGKIRSTSYDAGDHLSHGSNKQAGMEGGAQSGRPSNATSDPAPVINPVVQQPVIPPPWPEWSDEFINEDNWDVDSGIDYFEDNFAATDFINLKAYHWLRPSEFLREPPAVVRFSCSVLDLITPNAHLCEKSEVLRYILSEISELYDYSIQNKFVECEGEGVAYTPNYAEDDRKWAPWSHIYSCCKAGVRGERPVYNSKGKYYVRLYFLGAWRRILVDDRIPVLPSGQSGLPLTSLNELWPLLLTKALLKVATVTWKGEDVKKFSAISAFTGWVFEWIDNIDGVNETELWADLENTLPKYSDPKRIPSCYTLLHPSKKKMKFGNNIEESDTFWWMPPIAVHPSDLEDASLKEQAEDEPFDLDTADILTNLYSSAVQSSLENGAEIQVPKTGLEVKWQRKTAKLPPSRSNKSAAAAALENPSKHDIEHSVAALLEEETPEVFEDKNEHLPVLDTMTVAKKKKKKGGIGAALDESKSEKKSVGPKKHGKKHKDLDDGGGKSKGHLRKRSKLVSTIITVDHQDEADEDDADGKTSDRLGRKSMKPKLTNKLNWNKVKNIVFGESQDVIMKARMSKSVRRSLIDRLDLAELGIEGKRKSDSPEEMLENEERKRVLPSVAEILYGVQKYAGLDYRNIVKNWENICGKDSPLSLVVVLKEFPFPDEETLDGHGSIPHIPPFLQHPIQLIEVRDSVLQKSTDRPTTPLWKRFRWKKWAMKKGLIPMEVDHSNDIIRTVKAKTPFVFKQDWYDFSADMEYEEEEGESVGDEEDDDDSNTMTTFFFSLKGAKKSKDSNKNKHSLPIPAVIPPPGTHPTTKNNSPPHSHHGRNSKANSLTPGGAGGPTLQPPSLPQGRSSKAESTRMAMGPNDTLGIPINDTSRKSNMTHRSGAVTSEIISHNSGKKHSPKADTDKGSSHGGETRSEGHGSNMTVILHEAEIVQGESDEDFDEAFKRKMLKAQEYIVPTSACVSLWFNCDDIARNLKKFCKFYTSQSIFGSCYILRREPCAPIPLSPLFSEIHSDLPKYPKALTEYKHKNDCLNMGIEFDRCKSYHVTDYHMDDREDIDSGFYMFSDCWTEQELILTVHVLQEEFLNLYNHATTTLQEEMPGPPPTPTTRGIMSHPRTPKSEDLPLTLVIESWDWRQGANQSQPLLICTWIKDRWISHVSIPAGRNTFRIWLFYQNRNKDGTARVASKNLQVSSDREEGSIQNEFLKKKNTVSFSVKIVSQTPIYVGSRAEVLSYMTNPPMLLLKQSERLANNLWGLFACFGKKLPTCKQNLRQLRRSYCPTYSQPNTINKFVRGVHDTFEELFVSLVSLFNDGRLDRMLVLTLRVLFLNPMIGRHFVPQQVQRGSQDSKMFQGVFKGLGKKAKLFLTNAVMTIQRYYRGWRVRRLFQLRNRSHRDFKKIEYNVRRIAYLLANETDSVFSRKEYVANGGDEMFSLAEMTVDPEKVPPTILPSPPHWALDMLGFLMERYPWLITLHPHANCVPHHVKIQEVEGELPQKVKDFVWYPFFREVLKVPPESKNCFVEIDLQVYPPLGIYMKVINNDNGKFLKLASNRLFSGRLFENKYGYTVLCYRWSAPTLKQELNDRPPSILWKLRLVTPHDQNGPRFMNKSELYLRYTDSGEVVNDEGNENRNSFEGTGSSGGGPVGGGGGDGQEDKRDSFISDVEETETEEFPRKLSLRRLSGYYTPNKDYSVCQYVLETDEKRASISLRFLASNERVRLRVLVWDCIKRSLVFDETCESGLIAPYIQLHLLRPKSKTSDIPECVKPFPETLDVRLTSPLSEDLEDSKFLAGIMSSTNYTSKVSSKTSFGEEDAGEAEEWDGEEDTQKNSPVSDSAHPLPKESGKQMEDDESSPDKKLTKRRYIISVYVIEDSWPLTDRELLYVFYRERKFFKSIKAHHCNELKKKKDEQAKLAKNAKAAAAAEGTGPGIDQSQPSKDQPQFVASGGAGIDFKVTSATETTTVDVPNVVGDQTAATELKQKEFQSVKRKPKRKDGETGKKEELPAPPPPTQQGENFPGTAMHNTPPQSILSESTIGADDVAKIAAEKKKDVGKIRRRMNGSLFVKYGGRQSQYVKHLDQPHWVMEIVTDSGTNYKVKSNWQVLRKRLLLAKDSWETGGVELLYQELSTRLDFLLENMVEENYNKIKLHKFSIIDPMTNLFSSLRMDEYDLTGFAQHEFIRLLLKAWSVDPEESKVSGEKFLQNRLKKKAINATVSDKEKGKEDKEEAKPTPDQLLDYIPKNLRKMAEIFQRRIQERELERERERQLQQSRKSGNSDEEENEDNEEDDDTEMNQAKSAAGDQPTNANANITADADAIAVPKSNAGNLQVKRKTAAADAKSEKTMNRKAKKTPTIPKVADNATTKPHNKKPKSEKERSNSIKGKDGKSAPLEVDSAGAPKRTSKADSGKKSVGGPEPKVEEPKDDYETELARIRGCEKVAEILKKYEQFFIESKTVRQVLLGVIRDRLAEDEAGPKKLLLTKTGISKYAEKGSVKNGNEHEEKESEGIKKEGMVANKLLQWAYDYSFLPPTEEQYEVIQDPCELPLFFMRTIMAEQKEKDEELAAQAAAELAASEAEMEE